MPYLFDGHNDCLTRIFPPSILRNSREPNDPEDFLTEGPHGHLDLARAEKAGLSGGLFAIFIDEVCQDNSVGPFSDRWESEEFPSTDPPLDHDIALKATQEVLRDIFKAENMSQGRFKIVSDSQSLLNCLNSQVLAMILHLEGCEAIDRDLVQLELMKRMGVRSLGLVWSRPNIFGFGVPFAHNSTPNTGPGLTFLGRKLVRACNEMQIMLDLAHINQRGFYDVAKLSDAPLVVSHTACHAICPSSRNLTDSQLEAVAESDGIVGITFHVADIRPDGAYETETPLDMMVDHFKHIAETIGTRHLGIGSDFDGALIPDAIGDATGLDALVDALKDSGFNEEELEDILWGNWVRVITRTWGE